MRDKCGFLSRQFIWKNLFKQFPHIDYFLWDILFGDILFTRYFAIEPISPGKTPVFLTSSCLLDFYRGHHIVLRYYCARDVIIEIISNFRSTVWQNRKNKIQHQQQLYRAFVRAAEERTLYSLPTYREYIYHTPPLPLSYTPDIFTIIPKAAIIVVITFIHTYILCKYRTV